MQQVSTKTNKKIISYFLSQFFIFFARLSFIKNAGQGKSAKQVVDLYKKKGFTETFVKIRFWDAPIKQVEKIIPKKGQILDLGCGEGILANYLAVCSPKRNILGVELSKERVKLAQRGLKNTRFIHGNIVKINIPKSDVIIINHVLHHLLSLKDQEKVLDNCFSSLSKNGQLVLVEVNRGLNFKYLLGLFVDKIVVPILFDKKLYEPKIFHRGLNEWIRVLEEKGFTIQKIIEPVQGPFPNIIIVAEKK